MIINKIAILQFKDFKKVPKVFKATNKEGDYKTLGTSIIYTPMSIKIDLTAARLIQLFPDKVLVISVIHFWVGKFIK